MRTLSAVFACLLLLPAAAGAGVELTLAAGYRTGDTSFPVEARTPVPIFCFTTPCILGESHTEEGEIYYTLILDVPVSRRWMVEVLLTEQNGELEIRSRIVDVLYPETYEFTTAQVGLLRHWGEGRVQPFATGALGVTEFESSAMAYERPLFSGISARPVNEDLVSGSLAAGLKAGLGRHIGLRLEGRAFWHDLPAWLGGDLWQPEASLGLTYRW